MPEKVRIDKWLWSVRIFKSRTLATDACKSGKVKHEGHVVKASHLLQGDEIIGVRKDGFDLTFRVVDLIQTRVAAPIAQGCYEDLTPEEERNKYKDWYVGKKGVEAREKGAGRPTKKERRKLEQYKKKRFSE